ncbi:hypothetical protein GCM10028791_33890 [Echinicola sediminis]
MRQFAKIVMSMFLLIMVTLLLEEMEQRTVSSSDKACPSGIWGEKGHLCKDLTSFRQAQREENQDLLDDEHHTVKNFLMKAKAFILLGQDYHFDYSLRDIQVPLSQTYYTFEGRAPPQC